MSKYYSINYSPEELEELSLIKEEFCIKQDKTVENNNANLICSNETINDFLQGYLNKRGVEKFTFDKETGIYVFRSVGMHIDRIDGETFMFPLKGNGDLQHFVEDKIEQTDFYSTKKRFSRYDDVNLSPIRLDHKKPHSFIAKTTCFAILCGLETKVLDKLFKDNLLK